MKGLSIVLVCLSALGFIFAVISAFTGPILGVTAEGFSHGCTNMALIAIALGIWFRKSAQEGE